MADKGLNSYSWENNVVVRDRLNRLRHVKKQICLPTSHRAKVLQLADEGFGHQYTTKVAYHIQTDFY